jgi:UDP-N-acetylmuramate--alanine ligase
VKTDKEHAKMLAAYDNAVYVFMSSKDIYKLEELVIEAKG